jgi:signal transduction histidine kinase
VPQREHSLVSPPIVPGAVGELFWRVSEAVFLVQAGRIVAWNPSAVKLFGVHPGDDADADETLGPLLGSAYTDLHPLLSTPGVATLDATPSGLLLDATTWCLEGGNTQVVILRDSTSRHRLTRGLARLSALGRTLLVQEPSLPDLLQELVDEAKAITGAAFSALLLLRPDHSDEVRHFVYNAPRELFPERLPRVVGLLAVPLEVGVVTVDDIRGHPAGTGIPVKHPPIGPLLAAPIVEGTQVIGEIAVANAPGARTFDQVDEQLLVDLAAHAGIAVRWAELRESALLEADMRREMIATARHDIRNPLTIGKGYVSMLETRRDRMSPDQLTTALAAVHTAFDRIEDFASRAFVDDEDLLATEKPVWTTIAVSEFLDALAADYTAAAGDSTKVVTYVEEGTPAHFAGDAAMVRDVLDNVVANAIKYGTPGSVVTVTARPEGQQIRFDVHNEGRGISSDDQQRLFDRYWRSREAEVLALPGTGLGLAIVRRLVGLHDGVAGVSSRPNEGTTFWVTFPRVVPTQPTVSAQPGSA